jgi:hypothetical protein
MPTNKKTDTKGATKKTPSVSVYKTKEERQKQARTIISEISKLGMSIQYEPVKELYECIRRYIECDVPIKINIPFPEADRIIVGELKVGKREDCVICLQKTTPTRERI